jgi:hypothetical protein
VSEKVLKRVRNYAVNEPSFTVTFAVWDLSRTGAKITAYPVKRAVDELLRLDIIELIEDHGRSGKVYAYKRPLATIARLNGERMFAELDDARIGELAPARGVAVPHTRAEGPSGRPGRDRKRQARGVKVKRQRQGT